MIRILYNLAWHGALPFVLLRLIMRGYREPGYLEDIVSRLGIFRAPPRKPTIWIHAVSVGETRAVAPLIERLRENHPDHRILLTHMTAAGRATAAQLYDDTVQLNWLPWDLPWAQRRFLRCWRPRVGIIMETELWPNLLRECYRAHVPVILANARLSARSAGRYALVSGLVRQMLGQIALVLAQTKADAHRFSELGARCVDVAGNLKFDVTPPAEQIERGRLWRKLLAGRRTVLLASTRDGEEALLLDALCTHLPADILIAIVPRHPQRFDTVAALIRSRGLSLARRSMQDIPTANTRVWFGDRMGEMFAWYSLADVAVIGGSWLPLGGQNLIEACAVGCPVVIGPSTFNFAEAAAGAIAAGAALRANDPPEMASIVTALFCDDPSKLKEMSRAGEAFSDSHRGAAAHSMALIESMMRIGTHPADSAPTAGTAS